MKVNVRTTLLVIALFAVITSCKKSDTNRANFENNVGIDLDLDVYSSLTDYKNGTNVIAHTKVPANGYASIPSSKFTMGKWYYFDTYSDDYSYSNWGDDDNYIIGTDSATPRRFKFGTSNSFIASSVQSNGRIALLNGNHVSTSWKAVGALDLLTGDDIWYSLSAFERSAMMNISKDHTGYYYYMSGTDTIGKTNFTFNNTILTYPLYILFADDQSLLFSISGTTVNPTTTITQPPSIDSAVVFMDGYMYVMARQ